MKRYLDCDGFHERLDLFRQGELSPDEVEAMGDHVESCRECALAFQVQEHLDDLSATAEEESESPERVREVWIRVRRAISNRAPGGAAAHGRLGRRWMLAAAAGIALLAISAGYLTLEVARLRKQEGSLEELVAEQGRRLDELETATAPASPLSRTMLWEPLLARRESLSVAEVRSILDILPPETTILAASEAVSLLERLSTVPVLGIREQLGGIELADGLQAVEMGILLDAVNLSPDRRISTARVLALYRGSPKR